MPENKMYDIGENRRDHAEPVSAPGSKTYYPSITVNDSVLPVLKGAEVGSVIKIEAEIKVMGTRIPEEWDSLQTGNYVNIEIRKIGEPE